MKILTENTPSLETKPILSALKGRTQSCVPVWLMRQAGRYLPEYKKIRQSAGSFLDLVYNPEWATEVTLQPIRRYSLDAAILFSDILVIPHALGQDVTFIEQKGPVLSPIRDKEGVKHLKIEKLDDILSPIYETVQKTKQALNQEGFKRTALIGFAGAPWTVACYMVEGGTSRDFHHVKSFAYREPDTFDLLISKITQATIHYLKEQIKSGAELLQLFDSWAGILNETQFKHWVIRPTQTIIQAVKAEYPEVPIIGFPKGAGVMYKNYALETGISALSLDQNIPLSWVSKSLPKNLPIQGNLDPVCLLIGGDVLEKATMQIMDQFSQKSFIFNLGHGVIKETPPEHISQLLNLVRGYKK